MATSPLDYILQGARKILDKGQDAFRDVSNSIIPPPSKFTPVIPPPSKFTPTFSQSINQASLKLQQDAKNRALQAQSRPKVRQQDWYDVANIVPKIAGYLAEPAVSGALSLAEVATGRALPKVSVPLFKGETALDSQGAKSYYDELVTSGVDPDKAYWSTAIKTGIDMSVLVPIARAGLRLGVKAVAPQFLIKTDVTNVSKQNIFDYLSGRKTATELDIPQALREAMAETFKSGTPQEKMGLLKGIDIAKVQPSRLGKVLGLSEGEANRILSNLYGFVGGTRKPVSGFLPGYMEAPLNFQAGKIGKGGFKKGKPVGFANEIEANAKSILETGKPVPTLPPVASKVGSKANPLLQGAKKYKTAEDVISILGQRPYISGSKAPWNPEGLGWKYKDVNGNVLDVPEDMSKILDKENFRFVKSEKVTKTSSNLYHTTDTANLANITKEGLVVGKKARFEGVSSPTKISFSANESGAKYYGGQNNVMLRTKRGYKPDDLSFDLLAGGEGYYTTGKNIPPEMLEVKINGKWQDLIQTKSQLTDIWNKANKNNADDALINEARKYKSAEEFVKAQTTDKMLPVFQQDLKQWKRLTEMPEWSVKDELGYVPKELRLYHYGKSEPTRGSFWSSDQYHAESFKENGDKLFTKIIPAEDLKVMGEGRIIGKNRLNPKSSGTEFIYDPIKKTTNESQLTDIWNKAQGTQTHDLDAIQALREAKGLSAKDIMAKHPDLNLKRDIPVTDIYGNKSVIPEGEALTPYELKGNKVLLQDGETYIVSKNQYQNIKGNALSGEAKPFAPELEGLEETVKGASKWKGDELYDNGNRLADVYEDNGKWHYRSDMVDESPAFKTRKEAMENAEADALGIYSGNETKYSQYTLPGGENYREILIKAPEQRANITEVPSDWKVEGADGWFDVRNTKGEHIASGKTRNEAIANALKTEGVATYEKQNFRSSHWDEPNVISHLRLNDRTYNGKKVTFMEELQSDWAREGRSKGFSQNITELPPEYNVKKSTNELSGDSSYKVFDKEGTQISSDSNKQVAIKEALASLNKGIPNNPLLKNWQELSIKRALKEAVDNNSDYFAWINGEQTSARYNLATYVEDVKWGSKGQMDLGPGSTKTIKLTPKDSANRLEFGIDDNGVIRSVEDGADPTWRGKKLDEVLGKGLADKIMAQESGTLSGEGLKFGGEWANTLYDKQVGNIVKDLTGAKIETLDMGLPIESQKTKWFKTNGVEVRPQDLIVGRELKETKQGNSYIITDILGDGKFKAISKNKIDDPKLYNADRLKSEIDNKDYSRIPESMKETFDISQKTTQQQGIKLTPEIKAKIRGEAPALKKPSGVDILKTIANNYRKNPKLGLSSDDVTKGLKPDSFDKAKKIRQMKTSAEIPSLERTAEMQGVTPVVKPKAPQKQTVKLTPPSQVASPKVTATKPLSTGEERTLEKLAQQQALKANQVSGVEVSSLPKIIQQQTPVSKKVGLLDYIRTPENVLKKIGLEKESKLIRDSYEAYVKELPTNIQKITDWSKRVSKESNRRIFRYLDNQAVDLNPKELKVAGEIKGWLAEWADRLGLPKDNRIAEYITHIFDDQLIKKEFDEDLAKIIADKIPGSVYNPFLEKRLGAKGYIEDTWRALDAYVKRATRKVHMDKALERLEEVSSGLEESQWKYIKRYADRINMRPTEADNLIDNQLKQIIGYKLGQRPVANISRVLRQTTFRGMLGANLGSALRNLTQGVNTYAKLGEKYTAIGYKDLLTKGIKELKDNGILADNLVQDRALSSTKKAIEKLDKGLFFFFDTAEKINRGSAYYGAKAKALAMGKSETGAIEYAKKIVRDTQFQYGAIDTPVAMNSDIVKVLTQFMTYPVKQTEFLAGMAKNKEYMGIARYVLGGLAVVYTVGQVLGMKPTEMIPFFDYASGQRKFGVPPSLKLPVEIARAGLGAKDQYGNERSLGKKFSDVAKAGIGVIPGGIQLKKTYEGAKSVLEGGSYDKAGRKQFEQGGSKASKLQSILFGKYAGKEAREYYDEGALSTRAKAKVKPIYDQIQQLKAQGKMDEALSLAQTLTPAEAEVYKSIKSAEKAKQTQELKKKVTPIYNKIQKLKANGQIDEALVIAQSLSEDEIRVYKLIKEADTKRRQLEEVISQ